MGPPEAINITPDAGPGTAIPR